MRDGQRRASETSCHQKSLMVDPFVKVSSWAMSHRDEKSWQAMKHNSHLRQGKDGHDDWSARPSFLVH